METAVVKYDKDVAIITALDAKYEGITIRPGNADDYAIVKGGLKEYRNHRLEVVDWHKDGKAPHLKDCKDYDNEKTKWLALLSPRENELKATRKVEDDRIAEIETKRIKNIRTKINDIRNLDYSLPDLTLIEMKALKAGVEGNPITEDDYQEFVGEAMAAVHNVLIAITNAIEQREKLDKEEATRKTENDRLEGIRVEQEAAQKKIDEANRKVKEAQAKAEAELKAAQTKIDEAERKVKEEQRKLEIEKNKIGEKRWRSRLGQLRDVGWNGEEAFDPENNEVIIISLNDLIAISDIQFDGIANAYNNVITDRKEAKAETDRKEKEEFEAQAKVQAELEAKRKLEQEAIAASERADAAEAEQKRQVALIPDRDKLLGFADELDAIKGPVINDVALGKILSDYIKLLQGMSTDIRKQVNEL